VSRVRENRTHGVRREALRRIPYSAGRNSEEMFLGRLAYLAGKPGGNKSMPGTRRPSGGVQDGVPLDPHGMAKAGLLEAQCAPRGALIYRPRSGHGLEEVSVGLMAYLDP
jgi:hypothetical protein